MLSICRPALSLTARCTLCGRADGLPFVARRRRVVGQMGAPTLKRQSTRWAQRWRPTDRGRRPKFLSGPRRDRAARAAVALDCGNSRHADLLAKRLWLHAENCAWMPARVEQNLVRALLSSLSAQESTTFHHRGPQGWRWLFCGIMIIDNFDEMLEQSTAQPLVDGYSLTPVSGWANLTAPPFAPRAVSLSRPPTIVSGCRAGDIHRRFVGNEIPDLIA